MDKKPFIRQFSSLSARYSPFEKTAGFSPFSTLTCWFYGLPWFFAFRKPRKIQRIFAAKSSPFEHRLIFLQGEKTFAILKTSIKKFWGTTENAVRIQIGAAITAYCLVAIVQKKLQTKRTTYELLQILSASLMDKTPLKDLFEKIESVEPTIFEHPFLPGFEF